VSDETFRGAVYSLSQKKTPEATAKAKAKLVYLLRSSLPLTAADRQVLADYLEGKHDTPQGRPNHNFFNPVHKAVRLIRASQERCGYKRAQAVELYKLGLQMTMGQDKGAAHFEKYHDQIMAELRRAKPRKKP
jgi:hypothetical protein